MQYKKLAQLYEDLSSTTKRLEKTEILSKFLETLHEEDREVIYLLMGDIYVQSLSTFYFVPLELHQDFHIPNAGTHLLQRSKVKILKLLQDESI